MDERKKLKETTTLPSLMSEKLFETNLVRKCFKGNVAIQSSNVGSSYGATEKATIRKSALQTHIKTVSRDWRLLFILAVVCKGRMRAQPWT